MACGQPSVHRNAYTVTQCVHGSGGHHRLRVRQGPPRALPCAPEDGAGQEAEGAQLGSGCTRGGGSTGTEEGHVLGLGRKGTRFPTVAFGRRPWGHLSARNAREVCALGSRLSTKHPLPHSQVTRSSDLFLLHIWTGFLTHDLG